MSTHKAIDRICWIGLLVAVVVAVLFLNGEKLGIQADSRAMGYEDRLFDTSRMHTLDITVSDWDAFLADCENEEYIACDVTLDGERFTNVALRAKGNSSLSSVRRYGNNRYSF